MRARLKSSKRRRCDLLKYKEVIVDKKYNSKTLSAIYGFWLKVEDINIEVFSKISDRKISLVSSFTFT